MPRRASAGTRASALIAQKLAALTLRVDKQLYFATRPIAKPEVLPVPTRHGTVRCLVYLPHLDAPLHGHGGEKPPVHVQLHGGAFMIRVPSQDTHLNNYIASEVGAVVINPDYRVAPQVQYPVAEEQCYDVTEWVYRNGRLHGWDTTRLSAGGTSAGGKLAINIAQMAHSSGQFELRALALGCAVVDATRTDRSSPKPNPMVNTRLQKLTVESYFPDATRRREPLASPFYDPNLAAALPPTLIMTGALDTLAPEMDDLATRLTQQGVPVTYRRYDNVDHGFSHFKPIETARDSIALTGEFLLETLR